MTIVFAACPVYEFSVSLKIIESCYRPRNSFFYTKLQHPSYSINMLSVAEDNTQFSIRFAIAMILFQ